MGLKNYEKLQILRAKALDLHERLTEKISFTFCSRCSSHGRCCVVSDCSPEERERLIAISDSLKELHNLITSLEKVRSNHKREKEEALGRIQESREVVRERVRRCSKEEKENLGVLEEVIKFVGDDFWWNFKNMNGISCFLVGTTRFGLKFLVIFATIYTTLKFAKNGEVLQKQTNDSRIQKSRFLLSSDGDAPLDVLCGRG